MKRPDFILGLNDNMANDRALLLNRAFELGITRVNTTDLQDMAAFVSRFSKRSNCKIQTQFKLVPGGPSVTDIFQRTCEAIGVEELETFSFEDIEDIKNNPQALIELTELKKKGCLQNIGVLADTSEAILAAAKIPAIQVLQVSFNLIENSVKLGSALKKAADSSKTIQAKAPFFGGALIRPIEDLPEKYQGLQLVLKKLKELAGRSRITMESLCLAYVLQQKLFSAVIVGADSKDQLVKNWQSYQSASRLEIQQAEIHRITHEDSKKLSLSL